MDSPADFVESRRPAGSKRSGKRDFIVDTFLAQTGHLTADDLVALIRKADSRISRATIYRTLQWMVDAKIAQKVDFGEGRSRYERAYRHPRHFHLICEACHRSFEFLSSDIEAMLDEVVESRGFEVHKATIQVHGTCERCRTGSSTRDDEGSTERLFARDALRVAIATEKSGLAFYTRAARIVRDARGKQVFLKLADEEKTHLATLQKRYDELLAEDPQLDSRPAFLFFKGAANGIFASGVEELAAGVDDRKALLIGIRCERGSHKFFKKYGDRFEDSEGKRIFLEFADEEKQHMDLLVAEFKALNARIVSARKRRPSQARSTQAR